VNEATGVAGGGDASVTVGRDALKIDRIETLAVRAPLARRFEGSGYSMVNRSTIVTRMYTSDGVMAEVYNGDTDAEQPLILDIIHKELAPVVLGRSASDPEGAWAAMEPSTNDILRDRGLALQAIACLDTAIWDVLAKAVGLPLHRLWGSVTDSLPLSVIGGYYHLDEGGTKELLADYATRFSACKFKVGGLSPAEDAERVRWAREAAGDDFVLMVDANQGYERAEAVDFGKRIADYDIRWFEEPCRWTNDRGWMRDVRYQTGLSVAAGQSEVELGGLRDLVVESAIDVSNFDSSWSGGPTVWRRAAGMCAAFGVEVGHHEEPQVSTHMLATVPRHTFTECFDEERDPFFWNLSDISTFLDDGRLTIPERPGFGINLDPDYVERYTIDRRVTAA
jgi:D-galactarolactone cycloisomerase